MLSEDKVLDITKTLINQPELVNYLSLTDFWSAPASTKYHDAYKGGLAEHSYQVAINCEKIATALGVKAPIPDLHLYCMLLGICHDLCKVNFYQKDFRNVKDETGTWIKEPCYKVREDHTSYGHGMTSYIRMSELITDKSLLKTLEIPVIYHMGTYDVSEQALYGYIKARTDYPWLSILQAADNLSCVIEKEE